MLSGVTHRLRYLFTHNISGGGQGAQWAREAGLGVSAGLGQGLWSGVCGLVHLQEVQVLTRGRFSRTCGCGWMQATQIFSRSLAFSGHIAFSSYNPSRNNCEKDTMVISLMNSMTSLYASVVIFSIMGFQATTDHGQCLGRMRLALPALAALGPSLHGCVRPCIIQGTNMEGIITLLLDMGVIPMGIPKEALTATCFMLQSRSYWLEIFDSYVASFNLIVFTFFKVVGVIYIYSLQQ
ncbi:sodium-dependent neutral amino acid transporter B(0)AT3-like [Oryctolagus cuniculus]|uniref:sodium-dependent neutral amino acid transporter B(0)AT3-like n=1 Tax=Oryctolagus cuniculus TaxID=9986 RepID=UPI0038795691